MIVTSENGLQQPRIGVAASRAVGNAIARNRAKRILREAVRPMLSEIKPGYDILLLARAGLRQAKSTDLAEALGSLMKKAHLTN